MGIIVRYITRKFLFNFLITLFAILLLSFLIDTIESSRTISNSTVSTGVILSFLYNKFKVVAISTFPLVVYLSLIILLFELHIKNEYLAYLTSYFRPYALIVILVPLILILSIVYFYLNDRVFPSASREVDRLLVFEFKRFTASWTYFYRDRNWFLGSNSTIYHYEGIDEKGMEMSNFEIYTCGRDGPEEILLMDSLKYTGEKMYIAKNLRRYRFKGEQIEYESYPEYKIKLEDEYEVFRQRRGRPSQMSFEELAGLIKLRERIGLDTGRYRYELYSKVINPVSLVLLCILFMVLFVERLYLQESRNILYYGASLLLIFVLIVALSQKISESSINAPLFAALLPLAFPVMYLLYLFISPLIRSEFV
jgi:lipopolysaccharide export LptBFGC system permease protein LptF